MIRILVMNRDVKDSIQLQLELHGRGEYRY